jgi:hypothetical protein
MARKSIIKKAIARKLATAQFESVDIFLEIQEEVEWSSAEERMKKTDKITKVLLIDFQNTMIKVAEELNIDPKLATVKKK